LSARREDVISAAGLVLDVFGPDDARSDRLSTLLLISAGFVLVVGTVLGGVVAGAAGPAFLGTDGPADRTQEDPSTLQSERDLSAFERQMAQRIQGQVESGAINLSDGDFASVHDRLDSSEYQDLLDSYRSVASETGNAARARNVTAFRNALTNYSRAAERYSQTYSTYQFVRSSPALRFDRASVGTGLHADVSRSLAWRLERLERRVEGNASRVVDAAEALDNAGGSEFDLDSTVTSVQASQANISARQAAVREAVFVPTALSVDVRSTNVSFRNPLAVSGRLQMTNGTALSTQPVSFEVGNQTVRTRTDAAGAFSFTYRPVALPLDTSALDIRYVPDETMPYLDANTTVNVSVSAVEPAITVSPSPTAVGYNDTLSVSGRVAVEETGVSNVSVLVFAEGRLLGNATTDGDGTLAFNTSFPAEVEPGTRSIQVRVPLRDRVIEPANGSASITVRERATALSVDSTVFAGRTVRVTGQLVLADGRGIANRSVSIDTDGEKLATVSTGTDGAINTTVMVPAEAAGGDANISARFDGRGLKLDSSDARTTVSIATSGGPPWLWLLGGGLLVVIAVGAGGGAILWRRRSGSDADGSEPIFAGVVGADSTADVSSEIDAETLLSAAREQLPNDPDRAVRLAYAAARASLEGPPDGTHWEFYRAAAEASSESFASMLRTVTEGYERASYATDSVSASEGEQVVSAVKSLIDE
jgi:urease beta subunit